MDSNSEQTNILLVDDDPEILSYLKRVLVFDYNIFTETDPKNALQTIRNKELDIHLIIADIRMPGLNGIKFLGQVKEIDPDIIRIILTGNADSYSVIEAVNGAKIFAILQKPCKEKKLIDTIEEGITEYEKIKNIKNFSGADLLTGVDSKRTIKKKLDYEIQRSIRYSVKSTALMINIDNFSKLNNIYGTESGDKVLKELSKYIKSQIREIDLIGRFNGDTFLIIFPETELPSATVAAEKIQKSVSNFKVSGIEFPITISGGVAEFEKLEEDELLNKLNNLLFKAKKKGKNRIEGFWN